MPTHENEPKRESNRAILAHVKEEMDEPRMSQSAREESRPPRTALHRMHSKEKKANNGNS
jgi:hypothetical protein